MQRFSRYPATASRAAAILAASAAMAGTAAGAASAGPLAVAQAAAHGAAIGTGPAGSAEPPPARPAPPDTLEQRLRACTACHGDQGRAGPDGYYPRIAGKPAGYLFNQLLNFRDGRRAAPMMTWMVERLPQPYLLEIAGYFAGLHPPYPAPVPAVSAPAVLARGRALVLDGDRARGLPACAACHGEALLGAQPAMPGLLGLPRDYLNAQFGAWRNGTRRAMAPDCMAEITRRLAPDDVAAVTAWLAAQPVAAQARPAPAVPGRLPVECGGLAR